MSIVSTPMAARVAEHWGVEMRRVLTGFKYIGDVMNQLVSAGEPERFLMGFEESCGYLTGMHVRDKDAVNAALPGMRDGCPLQGLEGKTLCAVMDELYAEYGTYYTKADSFAFAGAGAMERMGAVMDHLAGRASPGDRRDRGHRFHRLPGYLRNRSAFGGCAHLGAGRRLCGYSPSVGHRTQAQALLYCAGGQPGGVPPAV